MSIFVGDTEPSEIYVGDTAVSEVYVGDTKVWPSQGVVIYEDDPAQRDFDWSKEDNLDTITAGAGVILYTVTDEFAFAQAGWISGSVGIPIFAGSKYRVDATFGSIELDNGLWQVSTGGDVQEFDSNIPSGSSVSATFVSTSTSLELYYGTGTGASYELASLIIYNLD
jgi:hypothetical protein